MASQSAWAARDPYGWMPSPKRITAVPAELAFQPLSRTSIASVQTRAGRQTELKSRVSDRHGITLPEGAKCVANTGSAWIGVAPQSWLAVSRQAGREWIGGLELDLLGLAAVCDQSDAYCGLGVSGDRARDFLAKGVFLDLHPEVFAVGDAAVVSIARIGATLWRRATDCFELFVFRSYAADFWTWLEENSAEFDFAIRGITD